MRKQEKNVWLKGDSYCIAQGHAAALNLMFETKHDHQIFLELWKKYLGDMAEIVKYQLTPSGWSILFKTHKENEIKESYKKQRLKSKKALKTNTLHDVGRILSEHFRIFLSQFVRRSNVQKGRVGTLVLKRFSKYVLQSEMDYKTMLTLYHKLFEKQPQKRLRYQANETQYDELKEMATNSKWKEGRSLEWLDIERIRGRSLWSLGEDNSYVLRKLQPPKPKPPPNT